MIHLRFQAFQEKSSLILLEIISLFLHLSSIHLQYSRTTISPGRTTSCRVRSLYGFSFPPVLHFPYSRRSFFRPVRGVNVDGESRNYEQGFR
jgi:hypothetical protein